MKIYLCEDSLESIFTAVYNIYEDKNNFYNTEIRFKEESVLFAEYIKVRIDDEKVNKVIRTIQKKFGEENYYDICVALASSDEKKGTYLFQTIRSGLELKYGYGKLFDELANVNIMSLFKLIRGAKNEIHHFKGFTKFKELQSGIMYANIEPKNKILTYLMEHFSDRFPGENFVIYDASNLIYGVHGKFKKWFLISADEIGAEMNQRISYQEEYFSKLFTHFEEKISIKEKNK